VIQVDQIINQFSNSLQTNRKDNIIKSKLNRSYCLPTDCPHDQVGDGVPGLVAARSLAAVPEPVLQLHRARDLAAVVHAHMGHPGSAAVLLPGVPGDLPAPAHRSLPDTVRAQGPNPASGHRLGEQSEQHWQQCGQERRHCASEVEEQTALGFGFALH